ncbi:NAD(P)H-binding protein [Spirillospora sp. CA-294931]|uniref:NmrA family NAD(P)-binding protein n=1 Tax=Spirillospora sp. CA-294931 TaxID=3240042 RepID=UPI003D915350
MTILVTGATGNVGRHLVKELTNAGHRVRALTRDPASAPPLDGVEFVSGDLTRPETLERALDGATGLHLITAGETGTLTTGPDIARLAEKAGVRRVTVLWGGERGPVEEAVQDGGLDWTLLEPTEFMSNALAWAEAIRTEGVVREPFAETRNAMVHEGDIARVAAAALTSPGHAGRAYVISGPEALTVPDKIGVLSAALGREIEYVELTEEQARERMRAAGHSEDMVDFVVGWHADPPPMGYTVTSTVEDVTGRPARSFAEWAKEHAARFA